MDNRLKQELFEQIKEKNDIVEVISEYVSLKRSGRAMLGLCPFHSEKTPSFNVNQEKQFFYCFGCGTGGDVFSFIMKLENFEFIEAAQFLAERSGIPWPEYTRQSKDVSHFDNLYKINKLAAAFFNQYLTKTAVGERARQYLDTRGILPEIWEKFQIGYAPATWQSLTDVLRKKSIPLEQAEKLGLVSFGENGYYDRFRDRVIFPITDSKGNIVGFGGRVMDNSQPKYLNSPETEIFHKGHFLFGLSIAKDVIRKNNQAIIVEGYLDVIQAHQGGFKQTVASLGTALTKEQAKLINKHTSEVILAYDADSAGQKATIRGMEILQEVGFNVKILRLPTGDDPDSLIKNQGAIKFNELLKQALPLVEFKLEQIIETYSLNTPEGRLQAVQAVFPEIVGINNKITQEHYLRQLVRVIGIDEITIFKEFVDWQRKNRKKSPLLDRNLNNSYTKETVEKIGPTFGKISQQQLSPLKQTIFETEKELLQIALQEYDKFKRIKVELKVEEFSFEIWRDLWLELQQIEYSSGISQQFLEELQSSSREVAASLIAEQQIKKVPTDLDNCLQRLKMLHLKEKLEVLTVQINTGRDENGQVISSADLKIKMKEFTDLKRKLQKEYPQFSAGI